MILPEALGKRVRALRARTYLPAWVSFFGLVAVLVFAEKQSSAIHLGNVRASVENAAELTRARLEGALKAETQLVRGLAAVLASDPDMDQSTYSRIVSRAIGEDSKFINVAVAVGLVVEMVHPFEANAAVLGLDYNQNDDQRAAALRARDSGELVLAGPVELVQGGEGLVARFPIFVTEDGKDQYWGLISGVIDVGAFYAETGLGDPNSGLEIALSGRNGLGRDGGLFLGDPAIYDKNPVLMEIRLPVGTWELAAIPQGGWPKRSENPWPLRLILLCAGIPIIVSTFWACYQSSIRHGVIATLRQREQQLERKQEELQQLSTVAQNASDSIVLTDPDARIIWVNDAFTQMTGYSAEEAVGLGPGDLLNGPETDMDTVAQIGDHVARGERFRTEILNYTKSGRKIWVDTRLVPVLDKDGAVTMVIGIERDVTTAKTHEMELAEAKVTAEKADRAKSEFLANMSHEIRTPMNGIIGMADLLADSDLPEEQRQYVKTISASSKALLKIINDILDLSRLESGNLSMFAVDFDLRACVDAVIEVLRPVAAKKGLAIRLDFDAGLPRIIRADDGRLRQILLNLVGNAVKFTDSGHVTLCVGQCPDDPYRLRFEVVDTGIGMTPDQAERVFDRFSQADAATTRDYGGTGLGLTISRHLADRMGGNITLRSDAGKGSCFTLVIQASPPENDGRPAPEGIVFDLSVIEGRRVLLAEDNRTNRFLIRKYLAGMSVDLIEAENGSLAVDLCARHRPDIVLMDMSMPEMDGISATRAIRSMHIPQPQIVALTANAFTSDEEACLEAGMNSFLTKPINKSLLLETMATMLANEHGA